MGPMNHVGKGWMNTFAAMNGDKLAMPPFVKIL